MQVSSDLHRSATASQRKLIFVPSWIRGGNLLSRPDEEVTLNMNNSLERWEFEEQINFKHFDDNDNNEPDSFSTKDMRESLPKLIVRAPSKLHDDNVGAFNIYRRGHEGIITCEMMEVLHRKEDLNNEKTMEVDEDLSFCSLDNSSNRLSVDSLPKKFFDPNIHRIAHSNAAKLIHVEPLRLASNQSTSIQSVKSSNCRTVTTNNVLMPENEVKVCTESGAVVKLVFPSPSKLSAGVATFSKFNTRLMKDLSSFRMSSALKTQNIQNDGNNCQYQFSQKATQIFHTSTSPSENILTNDNPKYRISKRPSTWNKNSFALEKRKKICGSATNGVYKKTKSNLQLNNPPVVNGNIKKRNPLSQIYTGNYEELICSTDLL